MRPGDHDARGSPNSPTDWLTLARQYETAARRLCEDKEAAGRAWDCIGFAIEAAIKAVIMHKERLNAWPSREARPELYQHSLRRLAELAEISVSTSDVIAPAWKTVLDWDRGDSYITNRMPRKVARSQVEAAFGTEGVLPWLKRVFLPNV